MKQRIVALVSALVISLGFISSAGATSFVDPGMDWGAGVFTNYDIMSGDASYDANNVYMNIIFNRSVVLTDGITNAPFGEPGNETLCGFIGFDVDQDANTGMNDFYGTLVSVGVDQELHFCMFDLNNMRLEMMDGGGGFANVGVNGSTLDLTIPRIFLGTNNGIMDFVIISGNSPNTLPGGCQVYSGDHLSDIAYGNTVEGPVTVPEPSTLMLLGSGLLGVMGMRKVRKG